MRVMVDSNIVISALVCPNGRIAAMVQKMLLQHTLCVPSFCLSEMEDVVRRKWPHKLAQLDTFLAELPYEVIRTPEAPPDTPYIRDPNDSPILAAAISGDVDVLISGDKDFSDVLLVRPEIMTPAQFAAEYL